MSCRKLILGFYSAEINTHGRIFIGFAALLFAILNIRIGLLSIADGSTLELFQLLILYGFVFAVGWVLFYVLFRTIGYGILANATIHAALYSNLEQKEPKSLVYPLVYDIKEYIMEHDDKILFKFPIEYFMSLGTPNKQKWGFLISLIFSAISTGLVYLLLEV